jgi:16S rRNA (cytidine1402-2'-O)-methyltransferase
MSGTLYLVATPIGNLEDITLRALRVLREVRLIAAEDTRRTAGLLAHFDITTRTLSLHEHNEGRRVGTLLEHLLAGEDVALVSDAGTPLISDPGARLVRAVRDAGVRVEAVPGASALLAALVASGIPADTFTFLGFPPSRAGARQAWIRELAGEPRTVVFFEAPHRIGATLRDLAALLPGRPMAIARELTKVHEEILVGSTENIIGQLTNLRGEFTIVLGGQARAERSAPELDPDRLWTEFCSLTADLGLSRRAAIASLSRRYCRPSRDIYQAIERAKAATVADR